jgi:dolichol-phosphate mannosyltransferase
MVATPRYDVSVVLSFGDDEDIIGEAVQRLAGHVRGLGLAFEILAVDEDSGDNSHAVLALLRGQVPELRVIHAPVRGRGADIGIARAQGRVLWILDPAAAMASPAAFAPAHEQVIADQIDAVVARGRFTVAHRVRVLAAADGIRGMGDALHRRLARRLAARGLRVDLQELTPRAPSTRPRSLRLFLSLAARRVQSEKRA